MSQSPVDSLFSLLSLFLPPRSPFSVLHGRAEQKHCDAVCPTAACAIAAATAGHECLPRTPPLTSPLRQSTTASRRPLGDNAVATPPAIIATARGRPSMPRATDASLPSPHTPLPTHPRTHAVDPGDARSEPATVRQSRFPPHCASTHGLP